MKKYRPGSMGAAEQKSDRRFLIGALVILGLLFAELYLGIFGSYLHDCEARAPWYANVLSLIPCGAAVYLLIAAVRQGDLGKNPVRNTILWALLLVFGICLACGFNFDLAGLKDRP